MAPHGRNRSLLRGFETYILKLVSEGASHEQWAEWLQVPLEHAVAEGNLDLVTRLLVAGAEGGMGWRRLHGRNLLMAAVQSGSEKMVGALLRAGARVELIKTQQGDFRTALHVAAAEGAEGVARRLLTAGADPNLVDSRGRGSLHVAAEKGHHRMIGDLVLHGALVNARDKSGDSPLHLATSMGYTLAVSTLLESGADTNMRNLSGITPLCNAVMRNSAGAAEKLLAGGADIKMLCPDYVGQDALDIPILLEALKKGNPEILDLLLRHGADVTEVDSKGWSILHRMCLHFDDMYPSVVTCLLLNAGAPVNARIDSRGYNNGSTPLHFAFQLGVSYDAILALLQGGAIVNIQNGRGQIPLHLACIECNVAGVEVLLRWGADETVIDGEGKTAADSILVADGNMNPFLHANCEILRRMLARAPADRAWRRRGWLVLCRYYPNRARLTPYDRGFAEADGEAKGSSSHATGSPVKVKRRMDAEGLAGGGGGVAREEGAAPKGTMGWQTLVAKVVGLDTEGVFRTVAGFL